MLPPTSTGRVPVKFPRPTDKNRFPHVGAITTPQTPKITKTPSCGREIDFTTNRNRIIQSKKINAIFTATYDHENRQKCFRPLQDEFPENFSARLIKIASLMLVPSPHRRRRKLRKRHMKDRIHDHSKPHP